MLAALSGIRILDLSQFEAGPQCTQTLAWLGADVIKVERPGTGEAARTSVGDPAGLESWSFLLLNSNKRSITLDFKKPEGMALLHRLIEEVDVFIENFAPGVIDRLGLSFEEVHAINPRVIYAQIKGFGEGSPWEDFPAFDPIGQAAGGSISMTGAADGPPIRPGASLADSGAGLHCAIGILAALHQRNATGLGQKVSVSMQDAVMNFTRTAWQAYNRTGQPADRAESDFRSAPKGIYPCKPYGPNDYVQIFTSRWGGRHWDLLLETIGRKDLIGDERYNSPEKRYERRDEVDSLVTSWTTTQTKIDAMELLGRAGVPAAAIMDTLDLARDPYLREHEMVVELEHPIRGSFLTPGTPIRLSDSYVPVEIAPILGRDNDTIYEGLLRMSASELDALKESGAI